LIETARLSETNVSIHLVVVDHQGVEHTVEALEGWRIMEIIRDWGLGIKGACGGACVCATCHVYVEPEWAERVGAPSAEEAGQLDEAPLVRENSRLSCQILMREEFDGLRLRLAPGSELD
jgi:ferredoxin, 2Fe-2S